MENSSENASHKLQISYRLLFERNPVPMWVYDVQTMRMLAVNDAALAQYGYSQQEFVGLTLLDLHHADDVAQLQEQLKRPPGELGQPQLMRHKQRNGELIEVETVTEALEFDGLAACLVRIRDMTAQRRAEHAQQVLAQQLSSTLEGISDGFFTLDPNCCFTYVNAQAEKLLQCQREELIGSNAFEKFQDESGNMFQSECLRVMKEGTPAIFETYYALAKGWRKVHIHPSAQGLAVFFRDVTVSRATEQKLLEERERLAAVIKSTSNAIIMTDSEGWIKMFNPSAEHIFGRSQASMLDQCMDVLLPERFRAVHSKNRHHFMQSKVSSRMMGLGLVKGLHADGREIDLEVTIIQITVQERLELVAILKDVTQRVQADAEIKKSREQLSELTQLLMRQEKTLIKSLAQTLHDQLGQTMAAIRLAHETVIALQEPPVSAGIDQIQTHMGKLISQGIAQVRQVLIDLRPPLLEEQGLSAALDNELRNRALLKPQVDISIDIPAGIATVRWPVDVEYAAFMVTREAVENALRHSRSSYVHVRLAGSATSLQVEITNDGVGMMPGAMEDSGYLGILGMQERSHAIGAKLVVEPSDDQGTCVSFYWQCAS